MSNKIKPAIICFPASNCEQDMEKILQSIYGLDAHKIWHTHTFIPEDVSHVIVPGGFSFGDYLRAGALAAMSPIVSEIKKFADEGKPVLGVCNGFQILCEAKLLPGVLLRNHHDRFMCSVVSLTWSGARTPLSHSAKIKLPIAHRDGRFFADEKTLDDLKTSQRIVLSYDERDEFGNALVNGSMRAIAGIVGGAHNNIIGMMPHPERMANDNQSCHDGRLILQDFLFGRTHETHT